MSTGVAVWLLVLLAMVAANLPWLTERVLFVLQPPEHGKREWVRLLEWLLMYAAIGALGVGLEHRFTGQRQEQDWEFYVITFCLFIVFALPGFIYRHDLLPHLRRRR